MGYGDKGKKQKAAEKASEGEVARKTAQEDAGWEDDDKKSKAKAGRVADKAAKAEEAAKKAAEKKQLEEEDAAALSTTKPKPKKGGSTKVTQAQVAANMAALGLSEGDLKKKNKKKDQVEQIALEPNTNRTESVEATGMEAALKVLEQRPTKVTYKEFEAEMMAHVQAENPGLKRAQLGERVFKLWERSPMNPKNQR